MAGSSAKPGIIAIDAFFDENHHRIELFHQAQKTDEEKTLEEIMHAFSEYLEKGAEGEPLESLVLPCRGLSTPTYVHLVKTFASKRFEVLWTNTRDGKFSIKFN